jgi:hypothetical protein
MSFCILQKAHGKYWCPDCDPLKIHLLKGPYKRVCKSPKNLPGVGTELKRLLRKFRIAEKTGCKCSKHSKEMNQKGPDWCEQNIETIVDWMQEEANRRHLPFVRTGAKILIRKAIKNTRKKLRYLEQK